MRLEARDLPEELKPVAEATKGLLEVAEVEATVVDTKVIENPPIMVVRNKSEPTLERGSSFDVTKP